MLDDDDLPLLSRVVRDGDARVIRRARRSLSGLGLPVHIDTGAPLTVVDGGAARDGDRSRGAIGIDAARGTSARRASGRLHVAEPFDPLDETLVLDEWPPRSRPAIRASASVASSEPAAREAAIDAAELDALVEALLERHLATLRRDLRALLVEALDARRSAARDAAAPPSTIRRRGAERRGGERPDDPDARADAVGRRGRRRRERVIGEIRLEADVAD